MKWVVGMKAIRRILKAAFVNLNHKVKIRDNKIRIVMAGIKIKKALKRSIMIKSWALERRIDTKMKK